MRGSAHFGFDWEWYRAHSHFWVIRTLQIERACAPRYLDALRIETWVSSLARVRSDRNYVLRRARDEKILARGIANWVYVNAKTMQPARIHPAIAARFDARAKPALMPIGKVALHPEIPACFEFTTTRRAQFYEADSALHINNAMYADWLEEAIRETARAMGYTIALDDQKPALWFYRHALEYARPALPGDAVTIFTRLVHCGTTSGVWEQELVHAQSREQILRAISTTVWIDAKNKLVPWRRVPRSA